MLVKAFITLAALWICEASYAPVLSRLGTNRVGTTGGIPLGQKINSAEFKDELTFALASTNTLELVVIRAGGVSLMSSDFVNEMRKFEIEGDSVFEQQVSEPYTSLIEFLATHPNVRVNRVDVDTINDGILKFIQAQNSKTPVIMLQESAVVSRSKREAEENVKNNVTVKLNYAFGDQCALFFESFTMQDETGEAKPLVELKLDPSNPPTFSCPKGYATPQTFTVKFIDSTLSGKAVSEISFLFLMSNNTLNYFLNTTTLTLDQQKYPLTYMGAPYSMETPVNYSFACTRTPFLLRFNAPDPKNNLKAMFYINTFQLQSGNVIPNGSNYTFGQINYCQGFFSSGIWMAITSSLLLTFILAFGVTALMTIQTNDRFDDPKGKPLNIGQEK